MPSDDAACRMRLSWTVHGYLESLVNITHDIFVRHKYISERAERMVCGHEEPQIVADLKSLCLRGGYEQPMPFGLPSFPE